MIEFIECAYLYIGETAKVQNLINWKDTAFAVLKNGRFVCCAILRHNGKLEVVKLANVASVFYNYKGQRYSIRK